MYDLYSETNYVFCATGNELFREHYRLCKIGDEILPYFACRQNADLKDSILKNDNLLYLGKGAIYSIDGVLQNSGELLHFWAKEG